MVDLHVALWHHQMNENSNFQDSLRRNIRLNLPFSEIHFYSPYKINEVPTSL